MSELLHFSEHTLQEVALGFMALVYTIRIIWFFGFKAGGERQAATGPPGTTPTRGILYSWANIAMPWAMESTRRHYLIYAQFVVFHLGVVAAITMSFVIADLSGAMETAAVVLAFQILIWGACGVGVMRIVRRVGSKYLRAISSPDDYFSLVLLTVWFGVAALAAPFGVPAKQAAGETLLITYYAVQTFFLLYVPFSKISHYLYYPFTRYYLGKTLGRRGVLPMRRPA